MVDSQGLLTFRIQAFQRVADAQSEQPPANPVALWSAGAGAKRVEEKYTCVIYVYIVLCGDAYVGQTD